MFGHGGEELAKCVQRSAIHNSHCRSHFRLRREGGVKCHMKVLSFVRDVRTFEMTPKHNVSLFLHQWKSHLPLLRQDLPLRLFWSSLVVGPKFFLFESYWKNMKNDTTFVRMHSGNHLGTKKCRKGAPRSVEFNFLINCDRQKRFSQNERRRVDLQNLASVFFNFCLGTWL